MNKILLPLLITSLFSLTLSGCGFRLRGSSDLPPSMKSVIIDGVAEYSPLGQAIRQFLASARANLVDKPDKDTIHFIVTRNKFDKRVLSVTTSGRANEYELRYFLAVKVQNGKGQTMVPGRTVQVVRDYTYNNSNVVASSDEENNIKQQMTTFAVRQAMRRISIVLKKYVADNNLDITAGDTQGDGQQGDKIKPDNKTTPDNRLK